MVKLFKPSEVPLLIFLFNHKLLTKVKLVYLSLLVVIFCTFMYVFIKVKRLFDVERKNEDLTDKSENRQGSPKFALSGYSWQSLQCKDFI
jgi:hypothetical protein